MKKLLVPLLFIPISVIAGTSKNSEVIEVEQRDDGVVKVQVVHGTYADLPNCSYSGGTFLFDGNTSVGKSMLSISISALMSGKKVNILSTTCYSFSSNPDTQLGKLERISVVK